MSLRILVTTVPFGQVDDAPLRALRAAGVHFAVNPLGRKLKPDEAAELIRDFDVVIAGTEPITEDVLANAPRLRFISRVGVGLDSVDLLAARRRNVLVSYTPEAPAPAVAELTIGLMLNLLRNITPADRQLRNGTWERLFGRRLSQRTVGIIGMGRIGSRVIRMLRCFDARVLVHDIALDTRLALDLGAQPASFEQILSDCDVVSVHVPLMRTTRNMIDRAEFDRMQRDAVLVNTARGGVVNEEALLLALRAGRIAGAAVDVFEEEPYAGPLVSETRCLLTPHMGSMSVDCRARMELEATQEAIRFVLNQPLTQMVPESEYALRTEENGAVE